MTRPCEKKMLLVVIWLVTGFAGGHLLAAQSPTQGEGSGTTASSREAHPQSTGAGTASQWTAGTSSFGKQGASSWGTAKTTSDTGSANQWGSRLTSIHSAKPEGGGRSSRESTATSTSFPSSIEKSSQGLSSTTSASNRPIEGRLTPPSSGHASTHRPSLGHFEIPPRRRFGPETSIRKSRSTSALSHTRLAQSSPIHRGGVLSRRTLRGPAAAGNFQLGNGTSRFGAGPHGIGPVRGSHLADHLGPRQSAPFPSHGNNKQHHQGGESTLPSVTY